MIPNLLTIPLAIIYSGNALLLAAETMSSPSGGTMAPSIMQSSDSANAARLLLNPSPLKKDSPNFLAMQQLSKQRELQDSRLGQCQDTKIGGWDQCFFYGTDNWNDSPQTTSKKPKIPTW
jgi:hypothetical protein